MTVTTDGMEPSDESFEEIMLRVRGLYAQADRDIRQAAFDLSRVTGQTYQEALSAVKAAVTLLFDKPYANPQVMSVHARLVAAVKAREEEMAAGERAKGLSAALGKTAEEIAPDDRGPTMTAEEAWQQYGRPAMEQALARDRSAEAVAWLERQVHPDAPLARRRAMAEIRARGTRISARRDGRFAVYAHGSYEPTILDEEAMERFVSVHQTPLEEGGLLHSHTHVSLRAPDPASLPQSDGYGFTPMRADRDR